MKTLFGENISRLDPSMILWQYWKNSIRFIHKTHILAAFEYTRPQDYKT